jgi:D-alanyl-D-alanine carboxypeptidase/D-alanyl-D-alanine-endopeptidase (penicillin-binding protein 4)
MPTSDTGRWQAGTATRALFASLASLCLLLAAVSADATQAVGGSASLSAAPTTVVFGTEIQLTGSVDTELGCRENRTVLVQSRAAGESAWTDSATGTTGASGGFAFSLVPEHTSDYRAILPETQRDALTCEEVATDEVSVGVAAAVTLTMRAATAAGSCIRPTIEVQPAKAGHSVELQRGTAAGWRTLATEVLSRVSRTRPLLCFGWGSIGSVELRALWHQQDNRNLEGVATPVTLKVVRAPWMVTIDELTAGHSVSVSVTDDGRFLYRLADGTMRVPASNEKLLLSMALLDLLGPDFRIETEAAGEDVEGGVVHGDLWILGRGDPDIGPGRLGLLARRIAAAGITAVEGSVRGDTGYFAHDWFAPGWKPEFPEEDIALPSALTFRGNVAHGEHVHVPERLAAGWLTRRLEDLGIEVTGRPGAGHAPNGLDEVATIESPPLAGLLTDQNRDSLNFHAEVLGKLLGANASGVPGTIAKGAATVTAYADGLGVHVVANDGSGLSYANRVSAAGLVRLLADAEGRAWGDTLQASLPGPGQGTLEHRLSGVQVTAKTGTLDEISALSGYVWLDRLGTWAEFSILSIGMTKSHAISIEDQIVRTLTRYAH